MGATLLLSAPVPGTCFLGCFSSTQGRSRGADAPPPCCWGESEVCWEKGLSRGRVAGAGMGSGTSLLPVGHSGDWENGS